VEGLRRLVILVYISSTCSTFIQLLPVTLAGAEALRALLGAPSFLFVPAFPENGRTVFRDTCLSEIPC